MKTVDLLYIEDNEDYVDFVGRAVNKINDQLVYHCVPDGKGALEYLERNATTHKCARVILLDINLPGVNGFDLLKRIRSYPQLKYVPVIMFSSSDNSDDVKRSYDNGANAYLVKPTGINALTETLRSIYNFWLSLNHYYS